jgi:hypothetical protein
MVWERFQGQLPPDAVKAGFVPEADLYVCRGSHRDGVQVGKLFNGRCNLGWGGHEISLGDFEILVDRGGPRWLPHEQDFPRDAVAGGRAAGAFSATASTWARWWTAAAASAGATGRSWPRPTRCSAAGA